jgi:hypothetical protein
VRMAALPELLPARKAEVKSLMGKIETALPPMDPHELRNARSARTPRRSSGRRASALGLSANWSNSCASCVGKIGVQRLVGFA